MLTAADDRQRRDYLTLAGAPSSADEIESKRRALLEGIYAESGENVVVIPEDRNENQGSKDNETENESYPSRQQIKERTSNTRERPIYASDELTVNGETVTIETDPSTPNEDDDEDGNNNSGGGSSGGGPSMGYRTAVDNLGMNITLQHERSRLRDTYDFDSREDTPDDYVFEVETKSNIDDARETDIAGPVIDYLTGDIGLPLPYPGFDILTVNPESGDADRLIELKSSGHDIRTPAISWNEWKTARTAEVSDLFYLYIVGNLRKDIQSDPYLREIPNPFELLRAETQERDETKKEVKVDVTRFRKRAEVRETSLTRD